jgi:hypothetical protein
VTTGTQLKLEGLEKAASRHAVDLRRAQQIAELIAGFGKPITSDDVRWAFYEHQGRDLKIGNAIGSLFANKKKWEWVGRVKSARVSSHARYVSQWRLRDAYKPKPEPFTVGVENGVRFCLTCNQETEACTCPK